MAEKGYSRTPAPGVAPPLHDKQLTTPPPIHFPPSPTQVQKRVSFMSYSAPSAWFQSLSSLTTSASSFEPPPHIQSVSGFVNHSPTVPSSSAGCINTRHWGEGGS